MPFMKNILTDQTLYEKNVYWLDKYLGLEILKIRYGAESKSTNSIFDSNTAIESGVFYILSTHYFGNFPTHVGQLPRYTTCC
jgi:hypothetical protein